MAKRNNEIDAMLENEIGTIGGDDQATKELGKLQFKSSYGQKNDLSAEESESLERFNARTNMLRDEQNNMTPEIASGWIPVNREEMGIRSQFYPEEWEFYVKPATMKAIKNWTAIDESRPEQVNKVFNEIIRQCVKINTNSAQGAGWAQIKSWDRFWFILKVREYTFVNGEMKVEFTDECSECGSDITYKLTSKALHYAFPDDDLIENYWNGREWIIDTTEFDVDHEPIKLYTPTLGKDEAIIDWATQKHRAGSKLDENFIEFLVWMLDKPSRDTNVFDKQVERLQKEYNSWSVDMYSFMRDVLKNITINPSENLSMKCPHCGQEAISGVQFPDGINALFGGNKPKKKFGSR
jgi:predicted RNA-binding Zn-ribbon protein involved in translation (DUF1610 family)